MYCVCAIIGQTICRQGGNSHGGRDSSSCRGDTSHSRAGDRLLAQVAIQKGALWLIAHWGTVVDLSVGGGGEMLSDGVVLVVGDDNIVAGGRVRVVFAICYVVRRQVDSAAVAAPGSSCRGRRHCRVLGRHSGGIYLLPVEEPVSMRSGKRRARK